MKLDKFVNVTKEALINMTDREIIKLDLAGLIERNLIINGYIDHKHFCKIELVSFDIDAVGFAVIRILSTKRNCRKPSKEHVFELDTVRKNIKLINHTNL